MDKEATRVDPRKLRTRQLLRDAYVDLLQEMDPEKITVNRLAERARINRVTFYTCTIWIFLIWRTKSRKK